MSLREPLDWEGEEQWVLLEDALPMEALQLGSLVRDCKKPAQDCYFPEDLADMPEQLVQPYKNYQATLKFASHAERTEPLRMIPKGDDPSNIVHVDAQESCIYRLANSWTWFETIRGSVDAQEWLRQQYSKDRDIYILRGLRTLTKGALSRTDNRKTTDYSAAFAVPSSGIIRVPSVSASVSWERSGNDRTSSRYEIRGETIFAVSYLKISRGFFDLTQTVSFQDQRNFLRRWSKRSRKGRPATRELGETDEKDSVSTRSSSPTLAVLGTFGVDSPPAYSSGFSPAYSSGFSARQEPMLTSVRQRAPPYRLESQKGTIDEFLIQSDGSQETMQLKGSRTPPESEDGSTDTDDNILSEISVLFWPSADSTSSGIEQWTNMLIGSSDLDFLYKKAIKAVPREIFERNLSSLLENFAEDLEGSVHSKSEEILTRFVKRYARRTGWLVTRHIYSGEPVDPSFSRVNIEVRSFLFNSPAFSRFQNALAECVDRYVPTSYIIAMLAFIIVLGPLSIAFIYSILSIFGPMSLPSFSSKVETHIINPFDRWLTRFIYDLKVKFRPRVKLGHQRIEWVCVGIRFPSHDCGTLLYDDFEVAEDESIDDIREYLNSSGPASGGSSSPPSRSAPALPHQVHVNSAGSVIREARGRGSAPRHYSPVSTQRLGRNPSPVGEKSKKYFELCVNSGKWKIKLGEIDITDINTDKDFFGKVAEKYESVRGFGAKVLFLLEPADIHFVRFTLEDCHLVNIDEEPDSWPTSEAVDKGFWEYHASRKMSKRNFLHYMRESGSHPRKRWFPTLPAKLNRRMTEEEANDPVGWGVHIIEGLNIPLAFMLVFGLAVVIVVIGVSLSIWKGESINYGQLCISVLAFLPPFLTSAYIWQFDP